MIRAEANEDFGFGNGDDAAFRGIVLSSLAFHAALAALIALGFLLAGGKKQKESMALVELVQVAQPAPPAPEVAPEPPGSPEPKPAKAEPAPAEPAPAPKPEARPEPKPQPKPEVKPEPKPEVKPEVKPEPKPEPRPEPKPEAAPAVAKTDDSTPRENPDSLKTASGMDLPTFAPRRSNSSPSAAGVVGGRATDGRVNAYNAQIKAAVEPRWTPPVVEGVAPGTRAVVSFVIGRSGAQGAVSLAKSSGSPVLDQLALRAVNLAKFPPLPPAIEEDPYPVSYGFVYEGQ